MKHQVINILIKKNSLGIRVGIIYKV